MCAQEKRVRARLNMRLERAKKEEDDDDDDDNSEKVIICAPNTNTIRLTLLFVREVAIAETHVRTDPFV